MQPPQHTTAPDHLGRYKQPGEAKDTEDMYSVPQGAIRRYSAPRLALHMDLLKEKVDSCPTDDAPVAIFTGGGPCSGKSAVVEHLKEVVSRRLAVLDADKFKEGLPEYREMVGQGDDTAANYVHEESSQLVKAAVARAIRKRVSFVYDSTFSNPDFIRGTIKRLRAEGYKVVIGFADRPPELAYVSEVERAKDTGRKVDKAVVFEKNATAVATFSQLHSLADEVYVFSTHSPEMKPFLKPVYRRKGHDETILDPKLLAQLHARGHSVGNNQ
jgi:predicted ABC-type ATPase